MAEELGSNLTEPGHSGELQDTPGPSISAPPVQAEELGGLSGEVQVLTPSALPAEEVENSGFTAEHPKDSIPGSGSIANALPEAAPPIGQASRATEAPTAEKVESSHPLSQPSQHLNIRAMSTSDAPQGALAQREDIAVDADYLRDNDSAMGDEQSSYSTSIASSVRANYFEHGRRYSAYKDSGYIRPNDETEVDRLDMLHHIFRTLSNGKLYEAPIPKDAHRVLDIGCGTGLWAIEFADDHPAAEVLGVDLSPIQPDFVPPNLKFEIDDIEEDFTYRRPFDYIHCRYMAYALKDWPRLMSQVYVHTAPGGFVEFTDFDLVIRSDDGTLDGTTLQSWGDTLPQAGRAIGREPCPGPKLEEWVRSAGFTNIVSKVYKLPIGPWAKDPQFKLVGAYYHVTVSQGVEAFSLRLYLNILKWSYDELQVLMAKVRKDLNTRSIHSYSTMYKVYAQKPGGAETSA